MGISRTLISGGISNKEALTGVVLPKDFIDAPKSVMQSLAKPTTYTVAPLSPPPPQALEPQQETAARAASTSQPGQTQKRSAFGMASLIGD